MSVEIIQVGDIAAQVRKGALSLDLPSKLGKMNATTKMLDYQSKYDFVWS